MCFGDISVPVLRKAGIQGDSHTHQGLFHLYLRHSAEEGRERTSMMSSKKRKCSFKTWGKLVLKASVSGSLDGQLTL